MARTRRGTTYSKKSKQNVKDLRKTKVIKVKTPLKKVVPKVTYSCDKCDGQFENKRQLSQHVEEEHEEKYQAFKGHPCNDCGQNFDTKAELTRHVKLEHDKKGGRRRRLCKICGLAVKNVTIHVKSLHPEALMFKCDDCDNCHFTTKKELESHRRIVHKCGQVKKKKKTVILGPGLDYETADANTTIEMTELEHESILAEKKNADNCDNVTNVTEVLSNGNGYHNVVSIDAMSDVAEPNDVTIEVLDGINKIGAGKQYHGITPKASSNSNGIKKFKGILTNGTNANSEDCDIEIVDDGKDNNASACNPQAREKQLRIMKLMSQQRDNCDKVAIGSKGRLLTWSDSHICPNCNGIFQSMRNHLKHCKKESVPPTPITDIDDNQFCQYFVKHVTIQGASYFKCEKCRAYVDKNVIMKHLRVAHKLKNFDNVICYECELCEQNFPDFVKLNEHKEKDHVLMEAMLPTTVANPKSSQLLDKTNGTTTLVPVEFVNFL